jgi:hypothetical protein
VTQATGDRRGWLVVSVVAGAGLHAAAGELAGHLVEGALPRLGRAPATEPPPAPPEQAPLPPLALLPVLSLARAFTALLAGYAGQYGYHRDEPCFLQAGRYLAWGYPDQPPFKPGQAPSPGRLRRRRIRPGRPGRPSRVARPP